MPFEYVADPNSAYVLVTFTGEVDDACLLEYAEKIGVEIPEGVPELVDLRGLSKFSVTPAGTKLMAKYDAEFAVQTGAAPVAIVAGSDLTYGMARMYQIFSESNPSPMEVFRSFSEANKWLIAAISALPEDTADPAAGRRNLPPERGGVSSQ